MIDCVRFERNYSLRDGQFQIAGNSAVHTDDLCIG